MTHITQILDAIDWTAADALNASEGVHDTATLSYVQAVALIHDLRHALTDIRLCVLESGLLPPGPLTSAALDVVRREIDAVDADEWQESCAVLPLPQEL